MISITKATHIFDFPVGRSVKTKKKKTEEPFDPVLFATTVPSRKPTAKDIADIEAHRDDVIEFEEYGLVDKIVDG